MRQAKKFWLRMHFRQEVLRDESEIDTQIFFPQKIVKIYIFLTFKIINFLVWTYDAFSTI